MFTVESTACFNDVLKNLCMHPTTIRLFDAIKTATSGAVDGAGKPGDVAKALGQSSAVVTNWKARGVSKDGMLIANAKFGINPKWIEAGEGVVFPSGLPTGGNPDVPSIKEPPAKWLNSNVTHAPSRGRIPLISWVKAGSFSDVQDFYQPGEADEWVDAWHSTPSQNAFALKVEGDSMTAPNGRSFPDGCTLIVDPNRSPKPGDFVVAKDIDAQRATFKQLTSDGLMSYLKPLNPAYPTQPIDNDRIRIVGVVIEWFVGGKL